MEVVSVLKGWDGAREIIQRINHLLGNVSTRVQILSTHIKARPVWWSAYKASVWKVQSGHAAYRLASFNSLWVQQETLPQEVKQRWMEVVT